VEGPEDLDRGVQPQPLTQVKYEIADHLGVWIISNVVLGIPSIIFFGLSFISVEHCSLMILSIRIRLWINRICFQS